MSRDRLTPAELLPRVRCLPWGGAVAMDREYSALAELAVANEAQAASWLAERLGYWLTARSLTPQGGRGR